MNHHVVPAGYPASGPVASHDAELAAAGIPFAVETPTPYKDLSWRWQHHDAVLVDPDAHTGIDPYGTRFNPIAWTREITGGDGPLAPYVGFQFADNVGADRVVDVDLAPVWTLVVTWFSLGPITNAGVAPPFASSSPTHPGTVYIAPQTVVADRLDDVWELYIPEQFADWLGGPGAWTLDYQPSLAFTWSGGGGATPYTVVTADPDFIFGGATMLEFDNTAQTVTVLCQRPLGGWEEVGSTGVLPSPPGGFPNAEVVGGGTLGPSFVTFFVHLYGYVFSLAVIGDTADATVELLSAAAPLPGTQPGTATSIRFRAADEPTPTLAHLAERSHYWPLDDASPGPMIDLLGGCRLTVETPADATFQVPGVGDPLEPTHTTAVTLGGVLAASHVTFASKAYLETDIAHPLPYFGDGSVGADFTISCWVRWDGPVGSQHVYPLVDSSTVPFGFADETAVSVYVGPAWAEPFGVGFDTWDAAGSTFQQLRTSRFDWPADLEVIDGVPTKQPTWALLTVVYRTTDPILMTIQKEIWLDGVLVAAGAADPGGWGADVYLRRVAIATVGTFQHLSVWPIALSAAEIAGLVR